MEHLSNFVLEHPLSSSDCELLLFYEEAGSVAAIAGRLRRDPSIVSRRLQRISLKASVLEKLGNHWRLTELGKEINRLTRENISQQRLLLGKISILRVGATRSFAAKALAANLEFLRRVRPHTTIQLLSFEPNLEPYLLAGKIDLGFSCGRPSDPAIRFRAPISERYVAVCSEKFFQKWKPKSLTEILRAPHLLFQNPSGVFPFPEITDRIANIYAIFSDGLCISEALDQGLGWTILPYFAVKQGVAAGRLHLLPEIRLKLERYGVWWLSQRLSVKPWVEAALNWLKEQKL